MFLVNPGIAVTEIRRQPKTMGLRRFALSLSREPIGFPARVSPASLMEAARQVADGVAERNCAKKQLFRNKTEISEAVRAQLRGA